MDMVPVVFGSGKRCFGRIAGQHLLEDCSEQARWPASLPTRRGLGAAPTPRLPSCESELRWAIDDFEDGLRRRGPYRPDGLETRLGC